MTTLSALRFGEPLHARSGSLDALGAELDRALRGAIALLG